MFAALPLMILPVLAYNLMAMAMGGLHARDIAQRLAGEIVGVPMASRVDWPLNLGDLFVAGALVVLFVELLKSAASRHMAVINHSLSIVLFIGCLVEFLIFPAFATSTFFLITLMVFLDVLAGFLITLAAERRGDG
ncbi:hypothetical protein [Phenylobacterium montanum]|uniref:Transmembrane protein n=1 Tax=Phenylobacterium montanum TaxID=2823693 RepID=A0A975FW31_9CAUL|nr:hypothetical protein [Caulobacter sp. S6]QUD86344.1 hypothetical protein KCG34_14685 [Caulobacter sp. S6]